MNQMNDGDYLIYSDFGACYIDKIQHQIDTMENSG